MSRALPWGFVVFVFAWAACGDESKTKCKILSDCPQGEICGATGQCVDRSTALATATASADGAPATVIILGPDGTPCPGACTDLKIGSRVTFRAPLVAGHRFVRWEGGATCVGTAPELVIEALASDTHCVARYVRRVRVTGVDGGHGTVSVSTNATNASCEGTTCEVDAGSEVVLTVVPSGEVRFKGWSGLGCDGTEPTLRVVARDADLSCTAEYGVRYTVSATAVGTQTAIVASSMSEGAECLGSTCTVDARSSVTLTAPVVPNTRFAGWSGTPACVGADAVLQIANVSASEACTGSYLPRFKVTASSDGVTPPAVVAVKSEDAFATCNESGCEVDYGGAATLIAPTVEGYRPVGWTGVRCEGQVANAIELREIQGDVNCVVKYVRGIAVSGSVLGAVGDVIAQALPGTVGSCERGRCAIDAGGSVTLTAPALEGARFLRWEGDPGCMGTENALTFRDVTTSISCRARYAARFRVRGTAAPATAGTVVARSASPTAACNAEGCTVDDGATVTLEATPLAGQRFTGWTGGGACTGQQPTLRITEVHANITCTANFAARFTVSGTVTPAGSGSVEAHSTSPSAECSGASCTVDAGQRVSLTARPADGFKFVSWSGCASSTDGTLTLDAVQRALTCRATFARESYELVVTRDRAGGDVAIVSPTPVCAGMRCTRSITGGTTVTIEARPATGFVFDGWTGCEATGGARATVTVTAATTCTANFAPTFDVTVRARRETLEGAVELPAETYALEILSARVSCATTTCAVPEGSSASVVARAANDSGWRFDRWECTGLTARTTSTVPLDVNGDIVCTAFFKEPITYDVEGVVSGSGTGAVVTATSTWRFADCEQARCTVIAGQPVTLVAIPVANATFGGWTCSDGRTEASTSIDVTPSDDDVSCSASVTPPAP